MRVVLLAAVMVGFLAPVQAEQKILRASGTFEVKLAPVGNESTPEGPNLARMSMDKTFSGDFEGVGKGELAGLTGKMDIIIEGKQHRYVFDYLMPKE